MPRRFLLGLIALSLFSRCATAPKPALDSATTAEIQRIVNEQMRSQHIPGAVLAIVRDDRVIYMQPMGVRDIEKICQSQTTRSFRSARAQRHSPRWDRQERRPRTAVARRSPAQVPAVSQARGSRGRRANHHPRHAQPPHRPQGLRRPRRRAGRAHARGVHPRRDVGQAGRTFRTKFQYSNAMYAAAGEIAGRVNRSTWEGHPNDLFKPLGDDVERGTSAPHVKLADHAPGYVYDKPHRAVPARRSSTALAPGGASRPPRAT